MTLRTQLKNFVRVLFNGAPAPGPGGSDSLATTARDLRYVNMSIEDDRLTDTEGNDQYVRSLE